jgi:hypothetical protein
VHAPQHALRGEARLLGDAPRRRVLDVGAQLHARCALLEREAGDEDERARRHAASARIRARPVPDLRDVLAPVQADPTEEAPGFGVDDCEGRLAEATEEGERVCRRVRLRDPVEPAADLGIAVEALDHGARVRPAPRANCDDAVAPQPLPHCPYDM